MKSFIKDNKVAISAGLLALLFIVLAVVANGCQLSDLVNVKVPSGVQKSVNAPPRVTLTQVPMVWEDWEHYVQSNTERFESETARAQEILGFISSLADTALAAGGQAAPGIPGGALIFGALTGAAGLFIRKPGDGKLLHQEKEDSYNAGVKKARAIFAAATSSAGSDS